MLRARQQQRIFSPQVFDCWFESGSMPYAQSHYPFENKDLFEKGFPADFIAEGVDQTRGWFYTLMIISTALFDKPPFKNLIVNGMVLAADGKKMSKVRFFSRMTSRHDQLTTTTYPFSLRCNSVHPILFDISSGTRAIFRHITHRHDTLTAIALAFSWRNILTSFSSPLQYALAYTIRVPTHSHSNATAILLVCLPHTAFEKLPGSSRSREATRRGRSTNVLDQFARCQGRKASFRRKGCRRDCEPRALPMVRLGT